MNVRVYYRSKHKLHRIDIEGVQDAQQALFESHQAIKDPENFLLPAVSPLMVVIDGGLA